MKCIGNTQLQNATKLKKQLYKAIKRAEGQRRKEKLKDIIII